MLQTSRQSSNNEKQRESSCKLLLPHTEHRDPTPPGVESRSVVDMQPGGHRQIRPGNVDGACSLQAKIPGERTWLKNTRYLPMS